MGYTDSGGIPDHNDKKPDEDDLRKLKTLLKYLKGAQHLKLTLVVNSLHQTRQWVDA